MQLSSVNVGQTILAREHRDGRIEDAPGFTIADMLYSVRQGIFDRTQVIDTVVECMKEMLAILEPQALQELETSEAKLKEYLGKLVETAVNRAISSTMASSGGTEM